MSKIIFNLQIACRKTFGLPSKKDFLRWLNGVLPLFRKCTEITVRIVDEAESHALNLTYRGKNKPTNVLSFSLEIPQEIHLPLIGDIVICRQVIEREAQQQDKPLEVHWAHIVIHGSLHLLGYSHDLEHEARYMELLEIKIMQKIGYTDFHLIKNNN